MLSLRAPFTLPLRSLYNPSVYAVRTQPVRGLEVDSKRLVRPLKRPFRDLQRGTVYIFIRVGSSSGVPSILSNFITLCPQNSWLLIATRPFSRSWSSPACYFDFPFALYIRSSWRNVTKLFVGKQTRRVSTLLAIRQASHFLDKLAPIRMVNRRSDRAFSLVGGSIATPNESPDSQSRSESVQGRTGQRRNVDSAVNAKVF